MKRSRRIVLTMMGSAAIGAVSMGFVRPEDHCGPGFTLEIGPERPFCRAIHGGFGRTMHHVHGHGHGHAGG